MDFKDIAPAVTARAAVSRTGFHDACGPGIFCNLGTGEDDFPNVRQILRDAGFSGWCRVDQHCDPSDTAARNTAARNAAARKATSVKVTALQSSAWPPGGLSGSAADRKIGVTGHGPGEGGSCVRAGRFAAASPNGGTGQNFLGGSARRPRISRRPAAWFAESPASARGSGPVGRAATSRCPFKIAHLHPVTEV